MDALNKHFGYQMLLVLFETYERNFIIFSDSKSALQAISGQDWTHPLVLYILERLDWLVQYQEKRILFYWIPSHVGIRGNEKADAAAKAGLSRRVTDVPIPYGDFNKHINVLLKRKWQSQWDDAVNNKLHAIHPQLGLWPGGSRIIRREESVLTRIRIGHRGGSRNLSWGGARLGPGSPSKSWADPGFQVSGGGGGGGAMGSGIWILIL